MLVVPPHRSMAFPLSHAVVAWQPTREATRALHDALPLLRNAGTVDVVMVDPVVGDRAYGADTMTIPTPNGPLRLNGLANFVTVRGGAYFFLPGRAALRRLLEL